MPDPFEVLSEIQLLALFGILERAEHRIIQVAYLSGWSHNQWQPLMWDLSGLAIQAYGVLHARMSARTGNTDWLYRLPTRGEWLEDESGESD